MTTIGKTAREAAEELRQKIQYHDHRYYVLDAPQVADGEYDGMMRSLRMLEKEHPEIRDENSPTQRVGGMVSANFSVVDHPEPMLSLANAMTSGEFAEWHTRTVKRLLMEEFPLNVEPKIDGLAIRLVYLYGRLVQGITRGNGESGEDVTHNIRTIRNIPLTLRALPGETMPETLEVRGEIYMPRDAFEDANREREADGESPYSNARNAAAGVVRQLDPALAARRDLRAWVYHHHNPPGNSHRVALRDLMEMGLPINPLNRLCWSIQEVAEYHQEMAELRTQLGYEIDGIVAKLDHISLREQLGATHHEPRWAMAWKFPSGQSVTKLREIRISHGRFGRLTPVAVLDPVELGGVTVQSASLHNEEDIHRKDIRPGTTVNVERAGDVIPQVTGPADPQANQEQPPFNMPERCPSCGNRVETRKDEVGHWCPNMDCPALLPEQLKSFVGKRAMEIDGLGEHWCQELVEQGLVENVGDLYFLTKEQLLKLDRMGERLADRVLRNIEESRSKPLERVLYSLGIFRLGRLVSGKLATRYGEMEEISRLDREQLESIEGIGPEISSSVVRGFHSERVKTTLERLKEAGVNMLKNQEEEKETMTTKEGNGKLEGLNLVVTGKLEGMTRYDAESLIRQQGGKASSSVTKQTNYLVVGEKPGSKLSKAQKLGVVILDQQQFEEMLTG